MNGLDLCATTPPVPEILDLFARRFSQPMLFAVQICERLVTESVREVTSRGDWSRLHIFESSKATRNRNGLILVGRGYGLQDAASTA